MLDGELVEREVTGIARGQAGARRDGGGRDEAIASTQGDASPRVLSAPEAGPDSFRASERRDQKPGDQTTGCVLLLRPKPSDDLLDVYGARKRHVAAALELGKTSAHGRRPAKDVDENRCVEEDGHALADAACVGMSLRLDPGRRVVVPLMAVGGDRPDRRLDERPALLGLERRAHGRFDEAATASGADALVEPLQQTIVGPKRTRPLET
jgi:hypothetical protein